jgi:hypothetical protein
MPTSTDTVIEQVEVALQQEARKIRETMGLDSVVIVVTGMHSEDDGDHSFWACARSGNTLAATESIRRYYSSIQES